MPTLWTRTLIPTSREAPADAEVPSHQLLMRAGMIHRLGSGIYNYLPLGLRALHKVMQIIREEMNDAGAVETLLSALQPIELWHRSGRRNDYGDVLFVVKDQHGREQALGPTHEEAVTETIGALVNSYRDLPVTLYQIQTKFRDEYRPRFGILRSREFQMKDAYSFDIDHDGLDRSYAAMYEAYCRIFQRCGVPFVVVEAESGEMGGSRSQQFTVPAPTGEDVIFASDHGYSANLEKCATGPRDSDLGGDPTGELAAIDTPECRSIADLCQGWKRFAGSKLKPANVLKTLIYRRPDGRDEGVAPWAMVVVRGDHEANAEKVRQACGPGMKLAEDAEARTAGFPIGFVGPHAILGREDTDLYIDADAARGGFWVAGGNRDHVHVQHFNWHRDVLAPAGRADDAATLIHDLRNAIDGDPAPDGGTLKASRGIEVGQVFKLGTKYSRALDIEVMDDKNQRVAPIMGCYGIGVNRILAASIESDHGHDDDGIIWPTTIAPYSFLITALKYEGDVQAAADTLGRDLEAAGYDVLVDDRDERPGVKFKDADLIGIPVRITVGARALSDGNVEIKARHGGQVQTVALDVAASAAVALLKSIGVATTAGT